MFKELPLKIPVGLPMGEVTGTLDRGQMEVNRVRDGCLLGRGCSRVAKSVLNIKFEVICKWLM